MEQSNDEQIVGMPSDFELSESDAAALAIDALLAGATLELGIFGVHTLLGNARVAASEVADSTAESALQLLVVVSSFGSPNDPRNPFAPMMSGILGDGRSWRCATPSDLSDAHIIVLGTIFETVETPILRARIADVLWTRWRPRQPRFAKEAVIAYLAVAESTFDADHWTTSYDHLVRAFTLASLLGRASQERATVVQAAFALLERLNGRDSLYYTQRIIEMLLPALEDQSELQTLLDRAQRIIEQSEQSGDFDRARAYFDVAIPLSRKLEQQDTVANLRLGKAETHVAEAQRRPTEMLRAMDLRMAVRALRQAGATRERRDQVAQMLDEAQTVAVNEMAGMQSELATEDLSRLSRDLVRGRDPIPGLWLLAGAITLPTREAMRATAKQTLERNRFAFGFSRHHMASDGRTEGQTVGSLGASGDELESAIEGSMLFNASIARATAAFGVIEPGRRELTSSHDYSLNDVRIALLGRPLIPPGHELLWCKGIHAGLMGEYDIAVHILAPQLENALRETLRLHGQIVYSTTDDGIQSLLSLERILEKLSEEEILTSDILFALESSLGERLGANVRNTVAHGIISDTSAQSHEAAFVWWLSLRLIRFFGFDAMGSQ